MKNLLQIRENILFKKWPLGCEQSECSYVNATYTFKTIFVGDLKNNYENKFCKCAYWLVNKIIEVALENMIVSQE